MPIPTTLSTKKKTALMGKDHYIKPDLSNLIKYIEDISQGLLFRDDSAITKIVARKIYDPHARTEFSLTEETDAQEENPTV